MNGSCTSTGGLPALQTSPGGTRKRPACQEEDLGNQGGWKDESGKEWSMDEKNRGYSHTSKGVYKDSLKYYQQPIVNWPPDFIN